MKDIFLSGIQGSGKGTQADLLLKHFPNKFKYFETGEILRTLSSTDNAIGNYIRHALENGILIKDGVVVELFKVFLQTVEEGDCLLLDGVLRKMGQTQAICNEMKKSGRDFIVLHFDLSDDVVYKRLASRIVCGKCGNNSSGGNGSGMCEKCGGILVRREDDINVDAVKMRIESFHKETQPSLDWVEENGWLVHINAERSVEEIFEDVLKYVN